MTSVTEDAGATVSFYAPANTGSGAITAYVITPYVSGEAQSATTVSVASVTPVTTSSRTTALQVPVTGLTNSTAYTFTVKARNSYGDSLESAQSGANMPLSGLVFGDDFNGPSGQNLDPEWWVYNRCGYLAQSEIEYYLPDHCVLDGSGNLLLVAEKTSYTGPSYVGGNVTQPWRSGACQSNTKTWAPSSGNTMTFESRFQICPDIDGGMWPGLFWLEGQTYLNAWKTDPTQSGWDTTGKAEIDIAEFHPTGGVTNYQNNKYTGTNDAIDTVNTSTDFAASMHVFSVQWKPGVSVTWFRDGTQTNQVRTGPPDSTCHFFLLLYLQILSGSATATRQCTIDYVRVYDQNLG